MNRSGIIYVLVSMMLLISCGGGKKGNTVVSGSIPGSEGQLLRLQELGLEYSTTMDSVVTGAGGKFSFRFNQKETGLYLLRFPKLAPLVTEINPGESIKISGPFNSFPSGASILGSPNSSDLLGFFNASALNKQIVDSLENKLITHQDEPDFAELTKQLDQLLKPVWDRQKALELQYIDKHPESLTSLLVLNHGLSLNPLMTFEDDSVYFLKLDISLGKAFPGNKHTVYHHNRIIQAKEVESAKKHSR